MKTAIVPQRGSVCDLVQVRTAPPTAGRGATLWSRTLQQGRRGARPQVGVRYRTEDSEGQGEWVVGGVCVGGFGQKV